MDWDLWNWSHDQVTVEHNAGKQSEWQCDFYFGYGPDIIEESALDEKSCIQVLRILIRKAEAELDELENDLVSLQTELAFAEHEEWPEICCNSLSDKIGCLDIAIKSLKSKSENDIEVQLSLHREPAEKIQDLIRKYLQEKDKQQPQQVIVLDPKPDGSASDIIVKEEFGEIDTPTEKCNQTNPSSNLQEKKTNSPKKLKLANANSTYLGPECLRLAVGSCSEGKNLDSDGTNRCWEAIEQELNCKNKNIIHNASLKHEEKMSCSIDEAKVNENMEARKQSSSAAKDLQSEGNQAYKQTNLSNAIVKYTSPDALIRSAAVRMRSIPAEFNSSTSRTLKSDDCAMEEKVTELCTKIAQNERINFPLSKDTSSNSQPRMVVNGRDNVQLVTKTEAFAMTLNNSTVKKSIMTKLNNVGEPDVEKSQKAAVVFDNSQLDSSKQQQSQLAKRKFQSNSQSIRETTSTFCSTTESNSNGSLGSSLKRLNSVLDEDDVSLVQLMGGKQLKKMGQRDFCAEDHNTSVAIVLPISQPQQSKRTSNVPRNSEKKDSTVNSNFSDSQRPSATDSGSVDNDPDATLTQLLSGSRRLEDLKLQELKAVARSLKLTKTSKLKKSELIEVIAAKRAECRS
ncbi:uncharacterized protein LOC133831507 isoform X2 [Humulus lupulus]|uniref:uncharacterized protein LOC133831507 isoform X2 n=1 Tax=Humulus lupulus TaxID=3486 RepID=UPI002B4032D0|nr:uncharacterized protein LOC133831507 isoform X2 [Humulus lupulus]